MARSSGIRVRHSRGCASRTGGKCKPHSRRCPSRNGHPCTCRDQEGRCWLAYEAYVWDPRCRRKIRRTFRSFEQAKSWRTDAAKALKDGRLASPSRRTVRDAGETLLENMAKGAALQLIDALPKGLQALYATAFFAGLRRGELRALRWVDIDDSVSVITVRRNWDDIEGEVEPKSKRGERTVPVAGLLRRYLLEHKA